MNKIKISIAVGLLFFLSCTKVVHSQVNNLTLTWTAPGDDADIGTASSYLMRWSSINPSSTSLDLWWNKNRYINSVMNLPIPTIAGTTQSVTVYSDSISKFITGNTYYFVIRTVDHSGNVSDYSNIASIFLPDSFPPKPIIDLGVRK